MRKPTDADIQFAVNRQHLRRLFERHWHTLKSDDIRFIIGSVNRQNPGVTERTEQLLNELRRHEYAAGL